MGGAAAERLVNLVICLLSTRQFLAAERIRDAVPGYESGDGTRPPTRRFKRMFERDKAELRDLGIPARDRAQQPFRSRGRLPHPSRRLRAAHDRVRRGRGGRGRPRGPVVAVGHARRAGPAGADQAAGRGHGGQRGPAPPARYRTWTRATRACRPLLDAAPPVLRRELRLREVPVPATRCGAPSNRGACCRGGAGGTSPASTATVASRAASASRASVGRCRPSATPAPFERPEKVDLLEMVAGGWEDGRTARVRGCPAPVPTSCGAARQGEVDGVLTIAFTETESLARTIAAAGASARALEPPDVVDAVIRRLRVVGRGSR